MGKKDRHLANETLQHMFMFRFSGRQLVYFWQTVFPGFSILDILDAAFNLDPDKFFTDPFMIKHSRVSYQLAQLSPRVRAHLRKTLSKDTFNPRIVLFDDEFLAEVYKWVGTDKPMPEKVKAVLEYFMDNRFITYYYVCQMDLYTIARALKVRKDGTRAKMCVFYFGRLHVWHIMNLLDGLYTTQKQVNEEYDKLARCILMSPSTKGLRPAKDAPDEHMVPKGHLAATSASRREGRPSFSSPIWITPRTSSTPTPKRKSLAKKKKSTPTPRPKPKRKSPAKKKKSTPTPRPKPNTKSPAKKKTKTTPSTPKSKRKPKARK
jgi:hypothetical protein